MSRQVNFFADSNDVPSIHSFLLETFGHCLGLLPGFRGDSKDFRFVRFVDTPEALSGQQVIVLVPSWAAAKLKLEPIEDTDEVFLNIRESPVFEYSPSRPEVDGTVLAVGRLYWAYDGPLEKTERAEIERVFRWVRANTVPIPNARGFRLFRSAATHVALLRFWGGSAEPNPLFRKGSTGQAGG